MKRRGHWKTALLLGIVLLFTVVMSACSGKNNESGGTPAPGSESAGTPGASASAPPSEEKHDPVTLRLITWNNTYQELYDKFHAKYPWITVEADLIGGADDNGIVEKIAALEAAGTPADLTWLMDFTPYLKGGLLEDLKPYMEQDENLKNVKLPDGFFESMEIGGKRLAIPFVDVPMWILVNKDLLDKYGLELPSNDWTYDDFRSMAKAATDPAAGEYGLTNDPIFAGHFATAMAVANGSAPNLAYMNADLTQSVLNSPAVLADVKWMQELMTKDGSLPGNKKAAELGDSVSKFITGKTLFGIGYDAVLESLSKEAKFEWDVLPFPKGKVKQSTYHIYGPIAMLAGSKHKDAAYKWISFQFEMEAQKWKIDHGANASVISDELNAYIDQSPLWKGKNKNAVILTKDMGSIAPGPTIPAFSEYMWWQPWVSEVILDGKDPNSVIPLVEAWNKKTLQLRSEAAK
ncbi:ABC transporter substrate-binding protein [Cohnella sp. REN36]|uniref:ABC transporter substrate-binding protein n=1 Tax=Cohnella sp. REN36 TaxID=2887347 RepID=UPI001D13B606|nr:extracellular solute-binding protein [Cohnella sp. REN36]MCC3371866.1 extracellular solute-binding protein [Cohnella sp. REN36]